MNSWILSDKLKYQSVIGLVGPRLCLLTLVFLVALGREQGCTPDHAPATLADAADELMLNILIVA